jgi:hypothetical protein
MWMRVEEDCEGSMQPHFNNKEGRSISCNNDDEVEEEEDDVGPEPSAPLPARDRPNDHTRLLNEISA